MAEGEINIDNIIQRLLEGKMLHVNNADEVPSNEYCDCGLFRLLSNTCTLNSYNRFPINEKVQNIRTNSNIKLMF